MKKITLLAIFAIAAFSNNANAQATANATATATIVTPISISKSSDMNFGNIATNGSAGKVVMDEGAVRTAGTGVTLPAGSTPTAATFTVNGEGSYTYVLTLPTSITLSNTDTTPATMIVDQFTSIVDKQLANGTQSFGVGATLNLNASQPAGIYTNRTGFDVTVNYN